MSDEPITEDHSDDEHEVTNADAEPVEDTPDDDSDVTEAAEHAAEARAEATPPTQVEPELKHGVDPITGGELPLDEARREGIPVMSPESRGDIRTDVTFPQHIQAPPAAQVAGFGRGSRADQDRAAAEAVEGKG